MSDEPVQVVRADLRLRRLFCSKAAFEQVVLTSDEHALPPGPDVGAKIGIAIRGTSPDDNHLGVQLVVHLEPDQEKNQPYRVEVAYVGEFTVSGDLQSVDREHIARTNCAAILLPYVRQAVTDLTSRGANGPVILPPVNVAAMLSRPATPEPSA